HRLVPAHRRERRARGLRLCDRPLGRRLDTGFRIRDRHRGRTRHRTPFLSQRGPLMTTPNIVVIQADQLAAQSLGAYGDRAALTPNIDALAETGAVFDRAYCNTPLCAPSRASMMTGRMPSEVDCLDNGDDFAASVPTFAHRLRKLGYHTALIGRM